MLDLLRQNASSWVIKALFTIIILAFILAFGMGGMGRKGDPVIAYVDGDSILIRDYETALQRTTEQMHRQFPDTPPDQLDTPEFRRQVLDNIVVRHLLLREAQKHGLTVTDAELRAGIATLPAFQNEQHQFDQDRYRAALAQFRETPASFESQFRDSLLNQKLRDYIGKPAEMTEAAARAQYDWAREKVRIEYLAFQPQDYLPKVQVSEEEIQAYYDANKSRFMQPATATFKYLLFTPAELAKFVAVTDDEAKAYYDANPDAFTQQEQVKARHILISLPQDADKAAVASAEKRIRSVLAKARAGQDFAALAKQYSDGPSAPNGGDLGWFGKGAMVEAFEKAAFATKKGDISDPVRTRFGWHIIKVEDRRDPGRETFQSIKDQIVQKLAEEKAEDSLSDRLDHAIDLVASGMSLAEAADELGVAVRSTEAVPQQALQQTFGLNPEATKTLFALPKGESTKLPLAVQDGYMLAQKVEETPETLIPLEAVNPTVTNVLKHQGAEKLARQDAEKAIADLKAGKDKAYRMHLKASEPFGRQGGIPELGANAQLVNAVFQAKPGEWLEAPFDTQIGVIAARLEARIPASEEEWDQVKSYWIAQGSQMRENELFQAYVQDVRSKAEVEIARPDVLN